MRLFPLILILLLALAGCECGGGKVIAYPFRSDFIDRPVFPDNYGVRVEWSKRI